MAEEDQAEGQKTDDAASADAAGGGASERVLNQNEIDSLMGVGSGEGGSDVDAKKNVLLKLLDTSNVNYERLPMLEVVFDRFVRMMSTSLRNFTSDNVEVTLDSISSVRFGDYLNTIPLPAMIGVFKAEEWDNHGLIMVDSPLIYSVVDVLLGGRRGMPMKIEGRPYTTIERSLIERMLVIILNDLSAAFDPLSPVTFRFDRLEINPRFAVIVRPANLSILTRFRVEMEDRGGFVDLLIPHATLEPIRELLLQMFMGEKFGRDSIWEGHLASQLWHTDIEISAVLEEMEADLSDVLNWGVGSRIMLESKPDDAQIELRCSDTAIYKGIMGQKNGKISVRIDQILKKML